MIQRRRKGNGYVWMNAKLGLQMQSSASLNCAVNACINMSYKMLPSYACVFISICLLYACMHVYVCKYLTSLCIYVYVYKQLTSLLSMYMFLSSCLLVACICILHKYTEVNKTSLLGGCKREGRTHKYR